MRCMVNGRMYYSGDGDGNDNYLSSNLTTNLDAIATKRGGLDASKKKKETSTTVSGLIRRLTRSLEFRRRR